MVQPALKEMWGLEDCPDAMAKTAKMEQMVPSAREDRKDQSEEMDSREEEATRGRKEPQVVGYEK